MDFREKRMPQQVYRDVEKDYLQIHKEIMGKYFPYTDQCSYDGEKCKKTECSLWLENKCWQIEFTQTIIDLFGSPEIFHISSDQSTECFKTIQIQGHGDKNIKDSFEATIELEFNSLRLAQKIKDNFFENWEIRSLDSSICFLEKKFKANPSDKDEFIGRVKTIMDFIPVIEAFIEKINTCELCKDIYEILEEYGGYGICSTCKKNILEQYCKKYFKKSLDTFVISISTNSNQTSGNIEHNRELVISALLELDPTAKPFIQPLPYVFSVETQLSKKELEKIEGIEKVQDICILK